MNMKKIIFNLTIVSVLILSLVSCAPTPQGNTGSKPKDDSLRYGAIALKVHWPGDLRIQGRVMYAAPAGVANMRITVTGTNISTPIVNTFAASAGSGTITGVPVGTCLVSVAALNSAGETIYEGTISGVSVVGGQTATPPAVTVTPPDQGDSTGSAMAISLLDGSAYPGSFEVAGDLDAFSFTASAGTDYVITTTGTADTYLSLYSSSDIANAIAYDDDSGTNLNAYISWSCSSSGTYYIVAELAGTGDVDYFLSVTAGGDSTAPTNGTVSIDSNATSTASADVTLSLAATDNVGVTGYLLAEDTGTTPATPAAGDSGWVAVTSSASYSGSVSYTLTGSYTAGDTVYVDAWFKDAAGNVSFAFYDSINVAAPGIPATVSASAGDGANTISWGTVSGATSYNIYWGTSTGVTTATGTRITNAISSYNHSGLTNGTTYYYIVTATGSFGESAASSEVNATPAAGGDSTAPTVSARSPASGATNVAVNANVYFEIDDNLGGSGVDSGTISIYFDSTPVVVNGVPQSGFGGTLASDGTGGFDVTINPDADFTSGQVVNVSIDAKDVAGNAMSTVSYSFTCVAEAWSATSSMSIGRYAHTATLLTDGTVLVAGGGYYDDTLGWVYLSGCELYDPATGLWSATGSLSASRVGHTATLLTDGTVLVAGGGYYDGTLGWVYLSGCELYDPATGLWSAAGSMSTGRYYHTATLLTDGTVLVTGGYNSGGYLSGCELYDPATGLWSAAGSLSTVRYIHTATLLTDGTVLVTGGYNSSGNLSGCELYDPATGLWSATGSMSAVRRYHTATLLTDGTVLVTGGYNSSGDSSSGCELYDPATGLWSATGSLSASRVGHTATLLTDGTVLVSGGYGGGGYLSGCELYDPATGLWSATGSLSTARSDHTATLLTDGTILAAGGYNSVSYLSGCELYSYTIPADSTAPQVTYREPGNGDVGIATDSEIYFEISDPLTSGQGFYGVARNSLTVTVNGGNAILNGVFQSGYSGAIVPDSLGGFYVTVQNSSLFGSGSAVSVGVTASDQTSTPNTMTADSYSFTTSGVDTWGYKGAMSQNRTDFGLVTLDDGKALVVGGLYYTGSGYLTLAGCELYDPALGTWSSAASMNDIRRYPTATLLNDGQVLVVGGYDIINSLSLASCELYDPAADSWSATGSVATGRDVHTATKLDSGKVLVVGGYNDTSGSILNSCEVYDPALGTWSSTPLLSDARFYHTATRLGDGRVLVVGGQGVSGSLSGCEVYDPDTNSWSSTGSLNQARYGHAAVLLDNGKVLVAGGYDSATSSYLSSSELYDPGTGLWTLTTGSLITPRYALTSNRLNDGRVLVAGGYYYGTTDNYLSSCEIYDPGTDSWTAAPSLTDGGRELHSSVTLSDGSVLVTGGTSNGVNQWASTEVYQP